MKKKKSPVSTKTRLRSAIRRVWMFSSLRREALALARIERGKYKCDKCSKIVGPKEIEINHKINATPLHGLETEADWGFFIWNLLFIPLERLEALCKECHLLHTNESRAKSKEVKKKLKNKA